MFPEPVRMEPVFPEPVPESPSPGRPWRSGDRESLLARPGVRVPVGEKGLEAAMLDREPALARPEGEPAPVALGENSAAPLAGTSEARCALKRTPPAAGDGVPGVLAESGELADSRLTGV